MWMNYHAHTENSKIRNFRPPMPNGSVTRTLPYPPADLFAIAADIEAYPASLETVRMAVERLREGGTVVTGVDRPFADSNFRPRFFGRPAALPVGHIRLALKFDPPVFAMGGCLKPDGHYELWASEPIEMERTGDKDQDVVLNAERVLAKIEETIRRFRTQWNMTYAVWPDVLPAVP